MTEIRVILDVEPTLNLSLLTKEEREILFNQIAVDNPTISRSNIDSFALMQEEILQFESLLLKPELIELLLRKIIIFAMNCSNEFNTIIIPVITTINASTSDQAKTNTKKSKLMQTIFKNNNDIENVKTFKIRFDKRILAVTENGLDYIVPPNEELEICGLIFNPYCKTPQILQPNKSLKNLKTVLINNDNIHKKIINGNYIYSDIALLCNNLFMRNAPVLYIDNKKYLTSTYFNFRGLKDAQISSILNMLFDYLYNIVNNSYNIESAFFIHTQINNAIGSWATNQNENNLTQYLYYNLHTTPINLPQPTNIIIPSILKLLETASFGRYSNSYHNAIISSIQLYGFMPVYTRFILFGINDKSVTNQLLIYKTRAAARAFAIKIQQKITAERCELNTFLLIIEQKFGAKKVAEIEELIIRKPQILSRANNILDLLNSQDRKIIEIEYNRRKQYSEAVLNNKCPHVKLYKQLRRARNDTQIDEYLNSLKHLFKTPIDDHQMIQCKNCNFSIICPHIVDYMQLDIKGAYQSEIKAKLSKYINRGGSRDSYYCKICGELISSHESFGDIGNDHDLTSTMNEELKNFMWGEIASLIKYLKFSNIIDVSNLITTIRDTCYPYIFEIEKQILKSKTNSTDEIKAKKRLFITIYAFAYIIHLILSNHGRGNTEISYRGININEKKNAIIDLIKYSIETILTSRNVIIREIPGITGDIIKNKLIDAYKSLQSAGTQVISYTPNTNNIINNILLDPIYKYIYNIYVLINSYNNGALPKSIINIVSSLDIILGAPIETVEKYDNVYDGIINMEFGPKWNTEYFKNLPLFSAKKTYSLKSIYEFGLPGLIAESYKLFNISMRDKIYTNDIYIDANPSRDPLEPIEVKFTDQFIEYHNKYKKLRQQEILLLQYRDFENAKNWTWLQSLHSRQWSNPVCSLGRIYDEDGNKHNFNIYICDDNNGQTEQKVSNIASNIEKGINSNFKIIDKKCSVCNILASQINIIDEAKIRDSLHARNMVNNFYRFYENRCPKGGVHLPDNDLKCKQCGFETDWIISTTSRDALNYYNEYKNIYAKERIEFSNLYTIKTNEKPKILKTPHNYGPEYEKWTFNFNIILDLASKVKINQRLLTSLGAIERQDYNDIQSGTSMPGEATGRNDTRIYTINTHIKNLLTEYNQLKYYHKFLKPSNDLSLLINSSGLGSQKIQELERILPDIYNDFNNRFAHIQKYKRPNDIIAFCIETFCNMCLQIWGDNTKETEKLRHNFVEYFIKKVLRGEELLTKPGYFNWSTLYGDKGQKDSYDMNTSNTIDSDSDSDDDQSPFSNDGFDMENDTDDDDNDNDINNLGSWGDDRGLD